MSSAEVRRLIADTSSEFRRVTEQTYETYLHKSLNKKCDNCWFDAYIILMRYDMTKLKEQAARTFELRAGAVLIDPQGDRAKMCNANTLTDSLALYHLRTHPKCIELFSRYPANWETLVAADTERAALAALAVKNAQRAAEQPIAPAPVQTTTPAKKTQQRAKTGKTRKSTTTKK